MATASGDDGSAWSTFTNRYFNVDGFANQTTLGFQDGEVTRYDLFDQAAVLRDYCVLLKGWQESGFSWVNMSDFIAYKYTNKFTHEVTTIQFADDQLPERAPLEVAPRYLTISKNTVIETSKNYNLGFPFNNRQMATPAGQEEFGLFSSRITLMFIELVSRLSLVKLLQPAATDGIYHNPNSEMPLQDLENLLEEEVITAFIANHNPYGSLPSILGGAKYMERTNPDGGFPTHVLFNTEQQLLLKFEVNSEARGTDLLEANNFIRMYGMDFRPVPTFSTSQNASDKDVGSMLSSRIEIGNMFPFRNLMLDFPPEKVSIATQGLLSIFSENANGMQDIKMTECNMADSRWAVDGSLTANHDGVKGDLFTFCVDPRNSNSDDAWVRCRIIGDMTASNLPNRVLVGMVNTAMKGIDENRLSSDIDSLKGNDGTFGDNEYRRLCSFAARMMVILGGNKHPLFRREAGKTDADMDNEADRRVYALRRIMRDIFKFNCPPLLNPGTAAYKAARGPVKTTRPRSASATFGLSYGVEDGDNALGVSGVHPSVAGSDKLVQLSEVLADCAEHYKNCDIETTRRIDRMQAKLEFYNEASSSDLSDVDLDVIYRLLDSIRTEDEVGFVYNLELIERLATDLQRVGKSEMVDWASQYPGSGVATDAAFDGDFAARIAKALKNPPFDFNVLVPSAAPAVSGVHPSNVYSGIVDFSDGKYSMMQGPKRSRATGNGGDDQEYMSNVWKNVSRVGELFASEVQQAVALMILLTPIHRDVFDSMLRNDVFIPLEYIALRSQMSYEGEGVAIVQSGSVPVGHAFLSYPAAEIGKSAMDMTGMMHVAQCVSIVIPDTKRRMIMSNLFYRRALGGANAKFFTPASWAKHVKSGYYSKGYARDSLKVVSVPVDSPIGEKLHVSGKCHQDEDVYHYASAPFYCKQDGYNLFSRSAMCLSQRNLSQDANGLCYRGTYATYGVDGKHNQAFENQGHHKIERVGHKILRQRGQQIRDAQIANMFQV